MEKEEAIKNAFLGEINFSDILPEQKEFLTDYLDLLRNYAEGYSKFVLDDLSFLENLVGDGPRRNFITKSCGFIPSEGCPGDNLTIRKDLFSYTQMIYSKDDY